MAGWCVLQGPRQRLVLLAAARNAGISVEVMEARLQVRQLRTSLVLAQ
jgi:hypothetical protein